MRNKKQRLEEIPTHNIDVHIQKISDVLIAQLGHEMKARRYAKTKTVLKLVGLGAFITGSLVFPTLPQIIAPFIKDKNEYTAWKRFNIPYLKRTLHRLESQKLIKIENTGTYQQIEITRIGKRKILRFALDELIVEKPSHWDKKWRLIAYDIPQYRKKIGEVFHEYLNIWGFYPFQKSVYLHAYPCKDQIAFLREYLGIGEYVRILEVSYLENDSEFREFFGV